MRVHDPDGYTIELLRVGVDIGVSLKSGGVRSD